MTAVVIVALIALALVVMCNVAWLLVWSRRRDHSGPNRIQVAGDNSTQISGTNITITAVNGSIAAHTIDGAVTIDHGKASVSPRRAGITRDGRVWEEVPPVSTSTVQAAPAANWHSRAIQEALAQKRKQLRGDPYGLAKLGSSDTIRPQTPWERQLAAQQEDAPDDRPGLAAILAGLYRIQSIAATLKMGPAVQHVGELPAGLTLADKNTLFYDENERCGYLWTGTRFLIEGAESSPEQPVPPEFLLNYASPIPVREFKATNSCPRCGWIDAHYLHTTDLPEGATIGRECTNCQKQWGEK
ncbi:zinc ribbon domain-containing protein [Mycobacteroides abscessus]|uniref:Uncharacterized protein n=1 Tax=Mycobacteroides abscessus subsp. massiliense TaxID=1962118 RepID=A0A1U0TG86_9MYCO|nr:hypothetical protein [Mycobacteroides abscessus]SKL83355.1 Uncharacterised protein [Mycobacteroides abscessus subsp. massiliense]SKS91991.1 Uncharacterised protein [Mycobacteroides abscessus subsp. massiliense]SKT19964.1 Uncharacterised protein [Mycobacteroides abscessus subsp. massiliense]SKW82621.1 Uncharacterised protein [Mycobacteroides abscessus subsp. massiliense]